MVILPQPIICPTMGLGLPILPDECHRSYHRGSKRAQRLCLDRVHLILSSASQSLSSSSFLVEIITSRLSEIGDKQCLSCLTPKILGALNDFRFPPPPAHWPAWKMHPANSFLVLPLSLSVLPLYNHGDCALSGCLPDLVFLKVWPRDHLYQNPLGAVSKRELVSNNIGYNSDLCNQNS